MTKVGLLDYGCGNIGSVAQAFDYLGYTPAIVGTANDPVLLEISHLVLPGVGAFERAASGLRDRHLHEAINTHLEKGRLFLGICVGMQVMMQTGYEFGIYEGLGLFSGATKNLGEVMPGTQCPHIGWDRVNFSAHSQFSELNCDDLFFYFNHSYVCQPDNPDIVSAHCDSGLSLWPVAIEKDNMIGLQCHPEKSHLAGLAFLDKFVKLS